MTTITIDGTARHAKGAPASQGGRFAAQSNQARATDTLSVSDMLSGSGTVDGALDPSRTVVSREDLTEHGYGLVTFADGTSEKIKPFIPLSQRKTVTDPYWRQIPDMYGLTGDEADWLDAHLLNPNVQRHLDEGMSAKAAIVDALDNAIEVAESERDMRLHQVEQSTGVDAHATRTADGDQHALAFRWSKDGMSEVVRVDESGRFIARIGNRIYEDPALIPHSERKAKKLAKWVTENNLVVQATIRAGKAHSALEARRRHFESLSV